MIGSLLFRITPTLALLATALSACAARGPGYQEIIADAAPTDGEQTRVVFLRPKDRDDGAGGGRAVIRIDDKKTGALVYGGFFFVDLEPGIHSLMVSGRYPALGACELQFRAAGGGPVYLDIGPRVAHMIAGLVGGTIGLAVVPLDVSTVSETMASTATIAVGSAAGSAAAETMEGQSKPCSGPYRMAYLTEEEALADLKALTWSK
ncbi:MAG: hypothetical protein AMJ59_11270 [Gammaproteobacteria bacterium SG8_31]|nr:MAG: hypothetical protein AMJ59_11270 [Gammaproteobacteria bacterium SG8_31]